MRPRSVGHAFTVVAILGLGIGLNVTLFAVADAVMFRPLPFRDAERLVIGGEDQTATRSEVSHANFVDWRARNRAFEDLAATTSMNFSMPLGTDEPRAVRLRPVSGNFFDVIGVAAARGRTLQPDDDRRAAARVVLISHGLWQRQFGGAEDVLGRRVRLGDHTFTIVGVMPQAFSYPLTAEAWAPLVPALADVSSPGLPDFLANRGASLLHVVGRLAPGVDVRTARNDLDRVIADLGREHGRRDAVHARLVSVPDDLLGATRPGLWALLGAVVLLLLVACANVAGLMLVQAARRRREFAIRMALGASTRAIARQLLRESAVLVTAASIAAIAVAQVALPAVVALVPADVPRIDSATIGGAALLFTAAIGVVTMLLCWLGPLLALRDAAGDSALRAGTRVAGGLTSRGRRVFVAAEIAIAVVLLTCAGLLWRSVDNVGRLDLGFEAERLMAIEFDAPAVISATSPDAVARFYEAAIDELSAAAGVERAALVGSRPLKGPIGLDSSWVREGQSSAEADENAWVNTETVSPGYFATMRTPLRAGRLFTDSDGYASPPVIIVNERLARVAWPGESPIGKRIRVSALNRPQSPPLWWTVVGVVADVRYRELASAPLDVYVPLRQSTFTAGDLMVRTAVDMAAVMPTIRLRLRALNPASAITITAMDAEVAAHERPWRANLALFGLFALTTVALAAVGLYALMASTVAEQVREIGVRVTLGASTARIVRGVLGEGVVVAVLAAGAGIGGSILGARFVGALLFGVSPLDVPTLVAAPLLLMAVAAAACAIPALRAARVDPAVSLRTE